MQVHQEPVADSAGDDNKGRSYIAMVRGIVRPSGTHDRTRLALLEVYGIALLSLADMVTDIFMTLRYFESSETVRTNDPDIRK